MRYIDMQSWPRRRHFEKFSAFDYPHFNLCAAVDLTAFQPAVKQAGVSFTVAIVYVLARAANGIPEFRYRIREGRVVEHSVVHPSITVLAEGDLFSFCIVDYDENFESFAEKTEEAMAQCRENLTLEDEPGRDDLLFMTAIPWVSFTGLVHPIQMHPVDSMPRIAWGKVVEAGGRSSMPLSVQGHHALMDGIHLGRYFNEVQRHLDDPQYLRGRGPRKS